MGNKTVIGIYGVGLDTYWPQFKGLRERLEGYQDKIVKRMQLHEGVEIVDGGLVDNPDTAREVGKMFRSKGVEAIFLYISTYALSHTVLPVAQIVGVPIIILNMQPLAQIDYEAFNALGDRGLMTGEWLSHCQACSVPEIAHVFNNAHLKYDIVTGYLDDEVAWKQIDEWISAISVRDQLSETRFGILGNYYNGMLDVYTDVTRAASVLGSHFELLEMDYLAKLRREVKDEDVATKIEQFNAVFNVVPECDQYELERAAKTSCALDALIKDNRLGGMAYYYEGVDGNENENVVTSVIAGNTLLTAEGIPIAGECEVKTAIAMKILSLFGAGGSYAEFYTMDFADDVVLWGHDGPAHPMIAEGEVSLVPLPVYHGKPGKGLSIQMSVKHGPVTLLAFVQGPNGSTFLLVGEGESVPGPTLQIGNTNSRYRFSIGARAFVDQWSKAGPPHHSAIGVGHIADKIEKLAHLLGIECRRIC
ncbi:MAG: arabinose isomerase [Spirochaetales bacterium]|nr:arabinose isomerase [Spirochaetales bacterium]